MSKQEDFIIQVELLLKRRIGGAIANSVLKNNLSKLGKNASTLTKEDGKIFLKDLVNALSMLATGEEAKLVGTELEKLLPMLD